MFLAAAQQLGVQAKRSIVVEDAIAGVQAGKRGGFGLVIGIARAGNADALKSQGADLVIGDLEELLLHNSYLKKPPLSCIRDPSGSPPP